MNVTIDDETFRLALLADLKDSYRSNADTVKEVKTKWPSKLGRPIHKHEDYRSSKKLLKALREVIDYYSNPVEFALWEKENAI